MKRSDPSLADHRAIPKGLQVKCLNEVEDFLKNNNDTYSAQEAGDCSGNGANRNLYFT